jgi:hypothetical protein
MKWLIAFLIVISAHDVFAQTIEKRTGETIYLPACGDQGDTVNFYRKTSPLSAPLKIGTALRIPGVVECKEIRYVMPAGSTREYWFVAVTVKSGESLEETNGVRVKRK